MFGGMTFWPIFASVADNTSARAWLRPTRETEWICARFKAAKSNLNHGYRK